MVAAPASAGTPSASSQLKSVSLAMMADRSGESSSSARASNTAQAGTAARPVVDVSGRDVAQAGELGLAEADTGPPGGELGVSICCGDCTSTLSSALSALS